MAGPPVSVHVAGVAAPLHAADAPAPLPAVVVWDFDNQTAAGLSTIPRERTEWLRRALSEHLAGALLQRPGVAVVERLKLNSVLAEQKLAASALAGDDSRLRLGRIVGAQRMVFGGFFVVGEEVQLHLRLVDTATGRVLLADEANLPFDAVMSQLGPLEQRLARSLGAGAPGATGAAGAAGGARPADDWPAELWQDHDRALALADAGQFEPALDALKALLQRRPDFTPAERQVAAVLDRMARR